MSKSKKNNTTKKGKGIKKPQHLNNQRAANNGGANAVGNGAKIAGKLMAYTAITITGTAVLAAAAVTTGTTFDVDTARKTVSVMKRPFHKTRYVNALGEDVTKILSKAAKTALRKGV